MRTEYAPSGRSRSIAVRSANRDPVSSRDQPQSSTNVGRFACDSKHVSIVCRVVRDRYYMFIVRLSLFLRWNRLLMTWHSIVDQTLTRSIPYLCNHLLRSGIRACRYNSFVKIYPRIQAWLSVIPTARAWCYLCARSAERLHSRRGI